jgi:putative acetyltransferase
MMSQRDINSADGLKTMLAASPMVTVAVEDPYARDSLALYDEMSAFILRTYPEDAENGITQTTTEELARDGLLVVARVDGVAAGSAGLIAHAPVDGLPVLEAKRVLVRPEFRGLGISKLMMRHAEAVAAERGAQKVVLMCGPRQPEALRLYEQCGYSRRSAYGKHQEHPLSIFFEKQL